MKIITGRSINLISFTMCCGLIAFAYYMEIVLNLQPCPLCVIERCVFGLLAFIFLVASIHNPGTRGQRIYGTMTLMLAIFGMVFAGRHLWLQGQPNPLGEICVPGISYLLKSLPLSQAIKTMFLGSADCAKVSWSFLGLSIPGWTFLFFDIFALLGLAFIKGIFERIRGFTQPQ
ncbi:MAG: disulfide bond formation protein B [Gammaproteobacteria bacterium]|nr:disulfide bond formation protein B [Gammaproteobacteria bacterium]